MVGRLVGGSVGRPVAGCWPGLLAFQRGSASRCSGTVSSIGNGRIRRALSPLIDSSGALGAANHPFPSTAGSVASRPIGANDHDATLNGRDARGPAARATTGTANHGAIDTTAFDGRDTVSGCATDNAANPPTSPGPTAGAPSAAAPTPSTSPAAPAPAATAEAPPAPAPPPMPAEAAMSDANRRQVQETLHRLGYYQGPVDGIFGPLTRTSIRRFQQDIGIKPTGSLTADEANRLVTAR